MATERDLAGLVSDTISDVTTLLRSEVRLARAEVNDGIKQMVSGISMIAAAVVFMLAALFMLLVAAVRWLAVYGVPEEWGYLAVGIAVLVIGLILLSIGISSAKKSRLAPKRAMEQWREDYRLAKEQVP